jgi:phosphoglycolate phosphatase-like HAD superfamily hydrolase
MIDLEVNSKTIPDVSLVIFDKDGTLIELYAYWSQMVALRARILCEALGLGTEHEAGLRWALGVDEKAGRLRHEGPVGLKKREIVLKAASDYLDGIGHKDTLRLCEHAFDRADEVSMGSLRQFILPIHGAASLMGTLHDRGCRVALATVDVDRRARLAMEFMGVSDTLDLVVGGSRDDSYHP